jgi:hypothetical protein
MSATDCWRLVQSKSCNGNPMLQDGSSWTFQQEPVAESRYFRTVEHEVTNCLFEPVTLDQPHGTDAVVSVGGKLVNLTTSNILWNFSFMLIFSFTKIKTSIVSIKSPIISIAMTVNMRMQNSRRSKRLLVSAPFWLRRWLDSPSAIHLFHLDLPVYSAVAALSTFLSLVLSQNVAIDQFSRIGQLATTGKP